jgi:hypothetical protein
MKRIPTRTRQPKKTRYICTAAGKEGSTIDMVNHPPHYGSKDSPYESIKVIRAWQLGFSLGNAVKYIYRAGKKDPSAVIQDLEKAIWYINEEIAYLRRNR